ncbi:TetR/AcrR family transcriptional regulator [Actinokineospora pegani]|uniref:TetR/AcrR family transcriptional regulator n=1 Tax=Actinokineospora pegani TaxID=2654637 RepID=UPI0012EA862F|nr:TetR family transcriptional regulator [Actinokineospora pegani]
MARKADPERIARQREVIIKAAALLFGTRGFERTTVAEVARAAGLSSGSVFYYFADKNALFRAVFEYDLPVVEALIARHADAADPVAAVLDVVAELGADAAVPEASGLLVEVLRRIDQDPELLAVVERAETTIRTGLIRLIQRGIDAGTVDRALDPVETAAWLQAVVDAAYLNARPGRSPVPELRRTASTYLAPGRADEHH